MAKRAWRESPFFGVGCAINEWSTPHFGKPREEQQYMKYSKIHIREKKKENERPLMKGVVI